jgi:hypothetical protein
LACPLRFALPLAARVLDGDVALPIYAPPAPSALHTAATPPIFASLRLPSVMGTSL